MDVNEWMSETFSKEYFWWSRHIAAVFVLSICLICTFLPPIDRSWSENWALLTFCADLLPDRRWLIIFEAGLLITMLLTYMGLLMYNEDVLTHDLNSITTIIDKDGDIVIEKDNEIFIRNYAQSETSGIADLPIMDVCQILYGGRKA